MFTGAAVVALGWLGYQVSFSGPKLSQQEIEFVLAVYGALITATGLMGLLGSRLSLWLFAKRMPGVVTVLCAGAIYGMAAYLVAAIAKSGRLGLWGIPLWLLLSACVLLFAVHAIGLGLAGLLSLVRRRT